LLGEAGGTGGRERRAEQVAGTEAPIRQGRLDNPWEGLVGGVVSGEARDAEEQLSLNRADPEGGEGSGEGAVGGGSGREDAWG